NRAVEIVLFNVDQGLVDCPCDACNIDAQAVQRVFDRHADEGLVLNDQYSVRICHGMPIFLITTCRSTVRARPLFGDRLPPNKASPPSPSGSNADRKSLFQWNFWH